MDYVISAENPSCSIASQQDETGELNRTSNSFLRSSTLPINIQSTIDRQKIHPYSILLKGLSVN